MPPKTFDGAPAPLAPLKAHRAVLELVAQIYLPNGDMLAKHFDTGEFDEIKLETRADRLYILGYVNGNLLGEFELKRDGDVVRMKVNTPIHTRRFEQLITNQD